jgi:transposase
MEELRPPSSECPGCVQRDRIIAEFQKRLADRDRDYAALLKRIDELEKRLDDAQRAGKRQAAPFSKGNPKEHPKKPGRKAGKEHGSHVHRPPPPPQSIDEILDAKLPDACPGCGGQLLEDDNVDEQFQTDIPNKPIRREFRVHKGCCKNCGQRVRGRHPLQTSDATGAAASQIGPNAQASVVYLNKHSGMSYGKIADYLGQACGLSIAPSTCTRIVLRAADKLEPVYENIKDSLKHSRVIAPDETGWHENGRPVWLHVAVGEKVTCYFIDRQRSADALEKIIGLDYSGILAHDGFASYDRFKDAMHQQCVAHPMQRAHRLEEAAIGKSGTSALFPRQVIDLFQEALELRDLTLEPCRKGRFAVEVLEEAHENFVDRLLKLTQWPRQNKANDVFARHLRRHASEWFLFMLDPTVPATNHWAEQALRVPIVNRKVFGGNRTPAGCRAQSIVCSTLQTCRQRSISAFTFVRDTLCGLGRMLVPCRLPSAAESPAVTLRIAGAG